MNRLRFVRSGAGLRAGEPAASVPLTSLLETWLAEEVITPEQADRMLRRGDVIVQAPPAVQERPSGRSSLVIEALGYLGGVVILVATILIATLYWDQVATTARLVVLGVIAAALIASGLAIPQRLGRAGVRLRSALWLMSTGAFAGFVGLVGADALDMTDKDVFLLISASVAPYAAGLWLLARTLVQQLAVLVSLLLLAAALTNQLGVSEELPGFAVWGVGLIWLLLAWGGLLHPRRPDMAFGAAGMFVGAMTTVPTYPGIALALVTATAVVATAVLFRDLQLLAVGALGTLLVLPASVIELFPGDLAAPVVMLVVGAALVGAGLFIAHRRRARPEAGPPTHDFSVGTPVAALTGAATVAATVTAVIVMLAAV